jgi:hypothetical protein
MPVILLWGIAGDGPLDTVRAALASMRAPALFLDQQAVLTSALDDGGDGADDGGGRLRTAGWSVDLASVRAVYLRPYDPRRTAALSGLGPESEAFRRALAFEDALAGWTETAPGLVVNRPSAMSSNNSKPYQLQLIAAAGFTVPETLVTTDPAAALEFWERKRTVIYKSVSGIRSVVAKLGPAHRERLADVAHCPTQFQEYVDGVDFRVHVVGDELFACEIRSQASDYRYATRDGADVRLGPAELPADVDRSCRALAASLRLPVTGIDLRRTSDGRWYCFEANPSPGFSFYEAATGQPIGQAVAAMLARAC